MTPEIQYLSTKQSPVQLLISTLLHKQKSLLFQTIHSSLQNFLWEKLHSQFQWLPITETVINFPGNFTFNTALENDNSTAIVQPFEVVIDNLFYISGNLFLINDTLNPVYMTTIWAYYSLFLNFKFFIYYSIDTIKI